MEVNNHKNELVKKACEINQKETKDSIVHLSIMALISFIGAIIAIFVFSNSISTAFIRVIAIFLILLAVLCVFTAICYSLKHKFFIMLVNSHDFEIVEKSFNKELWLCLHISDTEEYLRVELIK